MSKTQMRRRRRHTRVDALGDFGQRGRSFARGRHAGAVATRAAQAMFLCQGLVTLSLVEAGLRFGTLPGLCDRIGVSLQVPGGQVSPGIEARGWEDVARTVSRAKRLCAVWPFGDTCLRRALLISTILKDLGPTVVIGVKRDDSGEILAHAWVEVGGRSIDPASTQFSSFGSS